jgi:transposase
MMGGKTADQRAFFYEFDLDERVPADHPLRRIDVFTTAALADLHKELNAVYSHTGRPSIDPQLLIRMLIFIN